MQNKPEQPNLKNIFVAKPSDNGQRIDNFLLKKLKDVSKSNIYKLLRKGQIRVNGKRTKPIYRVLTEDKIRIPPFLIPQENGELYISDSLCKRVRAAIVFQNKNFVVFNKPSGLAVHSGTGVRVGLIEVAKKLFAQTDIQLAHRLDRDTSGCVVLTKNRTALNDFNQQSKNNQITKKYTALLQGTIKNSFMCELALDTTARVNGEKTVQVCESGKYAKTRFDLIENYNKILPSSLVSCQLFTGRTHQIRVHSQACDHPIAGDKRYGNGKFNQKIRKLGLKRLFLHAASIEFYDNDEKIIVSAELPDALHQVLSQL